jgi:hypothetical protein
MPGPARFQRRGDPANNGFRDVGHKLARLVDAFARSLHRVGNVGAVHHAAAVEAGLGTEHAYKFCRDGPAAPCGRGRPRHVRAPGKPMGTATQDFGAPPAPPLKISLYLRRGRGGAHHLVQSQLEEACGKDTRLPEGLTLKPYLEAPREKP